MRLTLLAAALALAVAAPAVAQTPPAPTAVAAPTPAPSPAPNPADIASPEAIVAALYDVISGDAGVARDWDRFRSLFHPTARLMPTGERDGRAVARAITPEDYITLAAPSLVGEGFHERAIAGRTERFGHIVHVWSTYEGLRSLSDPAPFVRGINSFQLFHDGSRWSIMTVYWQAETPQTPIPAAYLPSAG